MNVLLRIRDQLITRVPSDIKNKVIANTVNTYTFTLDYDDEWDDLSKVIIFTNKRISKVLVVNSSIKDTPQKIPNEVLGSGWLFVSVVGYGDEGEEILTTRRMNCCNAIRVYPSGDLDGDEPYDPSPSLADQILSALGQAFEMAQSVKDDADAGKFTGNNFKILGRYDTLSDLQAAIPNPEAGDSYEVGTAYPYTVMIYTYDDTIKGMAWVDNGHLSGADGVDGIDGISISNAAINVEGHLIITMSDDSIIDCGFTKGQDGLNGQDGIDGMDGINGTDGIDGTNGVDGKSIEFNWDKTSLGVRQEGQPTYNYVDLKGEKGIDGIDGINGKDGKDGVDGVDGKSIEYNWNGTLLGIRHEGDTTYNYTDLKGQKGDQGEVGAGFIVLGYFNTVSDLQTTVYNPETGDAYGVGLAEPYDIYIWDGINAVWVNNGALQGARGENGADGQDGNPGEAATIEIGTVTTGEPDTSVVVTNSGDSSNAILNFTIPKGSKGNTGDIGLRGETGNPGQDGYSPIANVTKIGNATTIYINDINGITMQTVYDGADGADGVDGIDGISVTHEWDGTSLSITSASGSSSANLKGDTGEKGEKGDTGEKGDKGDTGPNAVSTLTATNITGLLKGNGATVSAAVKTDITALGIPGQDTTYANATTSAAGLMSTDDKTKLDGVAAYADVSVNSDWNASSGKAQILNKPTIPDAYTKTESDLKYLQEELDPTVPSWAKQASKPSYSAADVGAVPTTRTVNGKPLSGDITLNASDVGLANVDNVKQMPISGGVLENYREKLVTLSGTSTAINLSLGNVFTHSLTGNTTYSITNAVNGQAHSFTLIITQTSTVRTLTFPASVKWQGGEIPDLSTASKTYILTFLSIDGGTTWLGMFGGEF